MRYKKKLIDRNMKQYDSYLIYGCHFPEKIIKLIESHSSLSYFNEKIKNQYNCKIIAFDVPIIEDIIKKKYYLSVIVEQSEESIIRNNDIKDGGFSEVLKLFDMDEIKPYFISVPIVRNLPDE